ncbi:DUF1501 domain-containing protein [Deminuibacter soli]|uniref:DUF1501 domain-containing protein n=1 Tax=Deminuibacter soli TaxID=2291815 RepID=A0A3E1ND39_9BACT|nr:DUF1501 domain-containing protein [Deminuibacter soli]RFM25873.1 DUF1501 domain-containing protein [Deminuibacter soli]
MKRRDFLKNTTAGVVIPYLVNGMQVKAMAGTPLMNAMSRYMNDDRVLVLIQLNGGNDGLNTVVPFDQYAAYQAARTNIAIPQNKVLRLNGTEQTGLHPALSGLQQLYNAGKLGIVQSVGYPKPNFSHFRAADIWMTASDSDKVLNTGWAGRYLDTVFPQFPQQYPSAAMPDPLAIQVGSVVTTALQGPAFSMGLAISNPANFYNLIEGKTDVDVNSRWGEQMDYLETMSLKTDEYAAVIKQAAMKVTKQGDKYPAAGKNSLADQLKIVARMIGGGLKTKIYMVNMGSFDTHAKQTDTMDTTTGSHAQLLTKLSEAITAFMDDLDYLKVGDRVMGMTFSEFGRRIKSNASGGTDHGAAAPMFYFGNQVKAGVAGHSPVLPATASVNDNIDMQHDFRSVYATVLQQWFYLDAADVQRVLGGVHPLLPIV